MQADGRTTRSWSNGCSRITKHLLNKWFKSAGWDQMLLNGKRLVDIFRRLPQCVDTHCT